MEFLEEAKRNVSVAQTMVRNGVAKDLGQALEMIKQRQKPSVKEVEEVCTVSGEIEKKVAKIEQVLQDFGKYFVSFKEESDKKLADIAGQMNSMKQELQIMRTQQQQKASSAPTESKEAQPAPRAAEPKKETSQRIGNNKPGDIRIDQVFSNAHNKMMRR